MEKKKVLFICNHNSARSQMAEAFLNAMAGDRFEASSAGLAEGKLNPLAVDAMMEVGIDISRNKAKTVDNFLDGTKKFQYVIMVCDESRAEQCPVFPGEGTRIHWSFEDPSAAKGTYFEKLDLARRIRDEIRARVTDFIHQE